MKWIPDSKAQDSGLIPLEKLSMHKENFPDSGIPNSLTLGERHFSMMEIWKFKFTRYLRTLNYHQIFLLANATIG